LRFSFPVGNDDINLLLSIAAQLAACQSTTFLPLNRCWTDLPSTLWRSAGITLIKSALSELRLAQLSAQVPAAGSRTPDNDDRNDTSSPHAIPGLP
jgi:hypothetical protein